MNKQVKSIAFIGLSTALALILAYAELLLPPLFAAVPGIKMGLPNIILIFLLYRCGAKAAAGVSLLRLLLVSVLFGNAMAFLYSLAGAALSMLVMVLMKRINLLSALGVSVCGAVSHNVGQILMAMLLLETAELGYYLLVLTVTGTLAGILIGLCGALMIRKIPQKFLPKI